MADEIDTGDAVFHTPTGETWLVAFVDGDKLAWCGWPEGRADLKDCVLKRKATPASRRQLLEQLAASERDDARVRHARAALAGEGRP